jgi:hypothetical protein
MIRSAYRATVFALYQLTIVAGILLLPFAVAVRKLGLTMPLHRLVGLLGSAYDQARNDLSS